MRRFLSALLPAALLLAGCGGASGPASGSGGELALALDGPPHGRHAGIYLAAARGYDRAVGVTLDIGGERPALRVVDVGELDPQTRVAVMSIQPGRTYLAASRATLEDRRDDVEAAVEAIQRGYEEAIVDPESAVAAIVEAEGLDRTRLLEQLDAAAPAFQAGRRDFGVVDAGALPPGTADPSVARPGDR